MDVGLDPDHWYQAHSFEMHSDDDENGVCINLRADGHLQSSHEIVKGGFGVHQVGRLEAPVLSPKVSYKTEMRKGKGGSQETEPLRRARTGF